MSLFRFSADTIFSPIIFYPQLVEATGVAPGDTEGPLYRLRFRRPGAGPGFCISNKPDMTLLVWRSQRGFQR